jgi:ribose transport system ATP-binding protein
LVEKIGERRKYSPLSKDNRDYQLLTTKEGRKMECDKSLLFMQGITKMFPGVLALNKVDFTVYFGEIHALVGENGAGKSTLMNIINGALQPEEGLIFFRNCKVKISSPAVAQRLGIGMVHQELKLFPDLSVAENIFFGRQSNNWSFVRWSELFKLAEGILDKLKVTFSVREKVRDLSIAQMQQVEIAKILSQNCKLIIMDEPTASLTPDETTTLFETLRLLVKSGISIIYISHRLEEVFDISDRITILRDGKKVGTFKCCDTNKDDVIKMMLGKDKFITVEERALIKKSKEIALKVDNLQIRGKLQDISFSLHKGEILGFAGLVGSGRTELLMALFGALKPDGGRILIHGQSMALGSPVQSVRGGLALIPEDRKNQGLIMEMNTKDNITLAGLKRFYRFGLLNEENEKQAVINMVKELDIRIGSIYQKVSSLSGGNQQKIVFARWMLVKNDILLLDEPTRGIDVGAKEEIFRVIRTFSLEGKSIIFVSSELSEVAKICDRVLVLYKGRIIKELPHGSSAETLTRYAIGGGVVT